MTPDWSHSDTVGRVADKVAPFNPYFYVPKYLLTHFLRQRFFSFFQDFSLFSHDFFPVFSWVRTFFLFSHDFFSTFHDFSPVFPWIKIKVWLCFLAIFWNEITTVLTPLTSEWGEWGGHVFHFGGKCLFGEMLSIVCLEIRMKSKFVPLLFLYHFWN